MEAQLGTKPELLWKLLLAQIVYDEAGKTDGTPDFAKVAQIFRQHQLLPQSAPHLSTSRDAQRYFNELLKEQKVAKDIDVKTQAAHAAEPLYAEFHANLIENMQSDVDLFSSLYKNYEVEAGVPQDERLKDPEN